LALGIVFANYNFWLMGFAAATIAILLVLPRFTPWFFTLIGTRVSEPQIKFVLLILFVLGGLANTAKSEAVLPAYLVGIVLVPTIIAERWFQPVFKALQPTAPATPESAVVGQGDS